MALTVKNTPANSGDIRDMGSIPGSGRCPGGGHRNPLQYSCLENLMDRGLVGYNPYGQEELHMTEATCTCTHSDSVFTLLRNCQTVFQNFIIYIPI